MSNEHILNKLYTILQDRKAATGEKSYVASLYAGGAAKIAEKILEEAEETVVEGINMDHAPNDPDLRPALAAESADLLFHLLVMLAHHNIEPDEVFAVLEKRLGVSGHDEKAARTKG